MISFSTDALKRRLVPILALGALLLPSFAQAYSFESPKGKNLNLRCFSDFSFETATITVDQTTLYGGYAATGTVTLSMAAPAGGVTVGLVSDNAAVHVPASVFVPAGLTTVTFPVTTDMFFGADRQVLLRTEYGDTPTAPFALTVAANSATFTTSLANVIAGSNSRIACTLDLAYNVAAPTYFLLQSDDPEVKLPPTILVKAGQKRAFVYATTSPVPYQRTATITTKYLDQPLGSKSLLLKVLTATLTFDRYQMDGGDAAEGFINLNANVGTDTVVPLSSGAGVLVPESVTVAAGTKSTSFSAVSDYVLATTLVPVSANFNGATNTKELRLAPKPILQSVTLQTYMYGQQKVTGKVRLKTAAPAGGAVVALSSSQPVMTVPDHVTVPEGGREATFTVTCGDLDALLGAYVMVTSGASYLPGMIELRPLAISSLTLSASAVTAGASVTGTVNLNVPVSVDTEVPITSQFPGVAAVPVKAIVPAGSRTATFTIVTNSPGASYKNVKITVSKHSSSAYRTLKVNP